MTIPVARVDDIECVTSMPKRRIDTESLTRRLRGRQVSRILSENQGSLCLEFSDGTYLTLSADRDGLSASLANVPAAGRDAAERPTKRQLEYLAFIAKYMERFGIAPAEADIQRHFLVSAPTVNQMMQMLERRGFITRQPGVPRSIRLRPDFATRTIA